MNPYRISLDKSWGGGFRVGQWVRYGGPATSYADKIGKIVRHNQRKDTYTVSFRSAAGGLFNYDCYPIFLNRVERDEIAAEIAKRNEQ